MKSPRYHHSRDCDGCDDVFDIWDSLSRRCVVSVPFWDDEDEAEEEARQIVRELNGNGPRHVRSFDDIA